MTERCARLFLLRHGPAAVPPGALVGSSDPPLTGQGLERLTALPPQLREIERWHCSPLRRARQTLDCLCQHGYVQIAPVYDQRLREIDFGSWELRTFADIAATEPEQVEAWQQYEDFTFPGGEAVADFVGRVGGLLAEFTAQGGTVGAVTHGGVIRTMTCLALGLPPRSYLLFDVRPASLTILDLFPGGGVLRGLNL